MYTFSCLCMALHGCNLHTLPFVFDDVFENDFFSSTASLKSLVDVSNVFKKLISQTLFCRMCCHCVEHCDAVFINCTMLQAFLYAIVLTSNVYDACVCVCVLFICTVQRNWACLTWKSAIEIKSLLLIQCWYIVVWSTDAPNVNSLLRDNKVLWFLKGLWLQTPSPLVL